MTLLFLYLTAASAWTRLLVHFLGKFYRQRGLVKLNYRGKMVAPALGPVLFLGYLPPAVYTAWFLPDAVFVLPVTMLLSGAALFGLWDDLADDQTSGFKGHFSAAMRGEITAGLIKAVTALLVAALFIGSLAMPLWQRLAALLLVLLSTNGLNLMDRRPGRAIKVFWAGSLLLLLLAPGLQAAVLLLPMVAATLAAAPADFRAELMLGDCGSNLLGAFLGAAAVLLLPLAAQIILLLFWAGIHVVAELTSISRLVEGSAVLRFLDRLGRSGEKTT